MAALAPDDDRRIQRVELLRAEADAGRAAPNGIARLAVLPAADGDPPGDDPLGEDAVLLEVTLLFAPPAGALDATNIRIEGGLRRTVFRAAVRGVAGVTLTLGVSPRGDFSTYVLRLVAGSDSDAPPPGFDPILSALPFSFRPAYPTSFDKTAEPPEPPPGESPRIDYLAKDYASFRRLMLDRIARLKPEGGDDNAADLATTLVELIAHVGDRLSYKQDAVATEAYLETARRRASAARHARLLDYVMHDGANARAFVELRPRPAAALEVGAGARLTTRVPDLAAASRRERDFETALGAGAAVFETLHPARLDARLIRIVLHDWDGAVDALAEGARSALLQDPGEDLPIAVGDWLLLEEVLGPATGRIADADRARRHVVRVRTLSRAVDPVGLENSDGSRAPMPLLEVGWDAGDALPFRLPLARVTARDRVDDVPAGSPDQPSAIARGNIVLADHGALGAVEETRRPPGLAPSRFRPALADAPVTRAAPFEAGAEGPGAVAALRTDPADARAALRIEERAAADGPVLAVWTPRADLIASEPDDRHVVVESEPGMTPRVRFGDDSHGRAPPAGRPLTVRYRLGNGAAGNVAPDAIAHVFAVPSPDLDGTVRRPIRGPVEDVTLVRNVLAATGGVEPESVDAVRRRAPAGLSDTMRAVTAADYVRLVERLPEVQRAAAREQWSGSWRSIRLIVDRTGGARLDGGFEARLRDHLEPYRLMGHHLVFHNPVFVPLAVTLHVCLAPDTPRAAAEAALDDLFSARILPDGRKGLFHPDVRSFGEPVRLSRLYAAARSVPGVTDVAVTEFKRLGAASSLAGLDSGLIDLGDLEIALLDNDPNFPDRGQLTLDMEGGR